MLGGGGPVQADGHRALADHRVCPRLLEGPRHLAVARGPKAGELRVSWDNVSLTGLGSPTEIDAMAVTVIVGDGVDAIVRHLPVETTFVQVDSVPRGRDLTITAALTRDGHVLSRTHTVQLPATRLRAGGPPPPPEPARTASRRTSSRTTEQTTEPPPPPPTPPPPPPERILAAVTGLSAATTTTNPHRRTQLTWTGPSSTANLDTFDIQRCAASTCGSPTTLSHNLNPSATTFLVTGLTTGTPYHYRIRASAAAGSGYTDSPWSGTVSHTPNNVALATVTGLTAHTPNANAATSVRLTWTALSSTQGQAGFEFQRCTDSACASSPTSAGTAVLNDTEKTLSGLTASTTYYFRIRATATAQTGYTDSPWSATVSHTTGATVVGNALPAVTGFTVTAPTGAGSSALSGVRFTWTAPASTTNIANFQIQRCSIPAGSNSCTIGAGSTPITITSTGAADGNQPGPTATSFERASLELFSGNAYQFRIRAVATSASGLQNSPWSPVVGYTAGVSGALATPGAFTASAPATNKDTSVVLTWTYGSTSSATDIGIFQIHRCATSACASPVDVTASAPFPRQSTRTWTVTGLTSGTTYHFRIRATKGPGTSLTTSAWSATVEYTTE